jgi:short-subunit dehydrogenase
MSCFTDKVCVITGASSGIGWELALLLAAEGAKLTLAARNEDRLKELADLCRQAGGKAHVVPTDVASEEACKNMVEETVETYGSLDMLINNAGISMYTRFDEVEDLSFLEKIMQINFFGSMYCTYYALPYLKKSKGRIVGISSLTGKTGVPTRTAYAASKHAMAGFFDSLRIELMDSGVSVTMIYPGFVATEVRERALGSDGTSIGKSPVKEGEVMTAEECAKIIFRAAEDRKREVVMTLKAKLGLWMKLIAPSVVDNIARKSIETGK